MKRSERENRIDSPYNWQAHYHKQIGILTNGVSNRVWSYDKSMTTPLTAI